MSKWYTWSKCLNDTRDLNSHNTHLFQILMISKFWDSRRFKLWVPKITSLTVSASSNIVNSPVPYEKSTEFKKRKWCAQQTITDKAFTEIYDGVYLHWLILERQALQCIYQWRVIKQNKRAPGLPRLIGPVCSPFISRYRPSTCAQRLPSYKPY